MEGAHHALTATPHRADCQRGPTAASIKTTAPCWRGLWPVLTQVAPADNELAINRPDAGHRTRGPDGSAQVRGGIDPQLAAMASPASSIGLPRPKVGSKRRAATKAWRLAESPRR